MKSLLKQETGRKRFTNFTRLTIGLFLFAFVFGCFLANLFAGTLYAPVITLFESMTKELPSLSLNRQEIFLFCGKDNLKYFLLLFFFSLTNVWKIYYPCFTLYTGFRYGLLFSFCMLVSGIGGIVEFLCFLMPHTLITLPVFLSGINRMELFHESWFFYSTGAKKGPRLFLDKGKRQLILKQLPRMLLYIALLLCAALLEGYINIPLLKQYHAAGL